MTRHLRAPLVLVFLAMLMAAPRPALAGPPLLCHPFDIGTARSLPMGGSGWQAIDSRYDVDRLVADTLAILKPDASVPLRMETIRRATIYASKHPAVAASLLAALQDRAKISNAGAPLAVFDFGYLVETYRQAQFMFAQPIAAIDGIDGYQLVMKAQAIRKDDAMAHAAKLIAGE